MHKRKEEVDKNKRNIDFLINKANAAKAQAKQIPSVAKTSQIETDKPRVSIKETMSKRYFKLHPKMFISSNLV